MNELKILLENHWIVKEENKELYYKIKDAIPKMKNFTEEKLGYQLIVNPYLIKLEKLPGMPESWMGIQGFDKQMEYALLCLMLVFLEDKGKGEQFVLSEVTEFLQGVYPSDDKLDWTFFQHRRSLIKVLRFAEDMKLIARNDGDENQFINRQEVEVLYESTGNSRYFMRNFVGDVLKYSNWQDLENDEWLDMDYERGRLRRNRVYRRLIMSPVVYQENIEDPDYMYIKNYRNMLQADLEKQLDASLHVHKNGAMLLVDSKKSYKDTFPSQKAISDIVLFMNKVILEELRSGSLVKKDNDTILISKQTFEYLVDNLKKQYYSGWSKTYREMTNEKLYKEIVTYMEEFQMLEVNTVTEEIKIMPIVGKIIGEYPIDFLKDISTKEGETDEK